MPDEADHAGGRVTVVSPHLDDAVLSIGGTIHDLTAAGADVRIVTVFAGDPDSGAEASYWDASRGKATEGEAVRLRRVEDDEAAAELGATTLALPWSDSGYTGFRDPDAIWTALAPAIDGADMILLPGWPLTHNDHRYTTMLVLQRLSADAPVVFYAEQPYASEPFRLVKGRLRNRTVAPLRHAVGGELHWTKRRLGAAARAAQDRALAHYQGELQNLGVRGRWGRLVRRVSGGEALAVRADADVPPLLAPRR